MEGRKGEKSAGEMNVMILDDPPTKKPKSEDNIENWRGTTAPGASIAALGTSCQSIGHRQGEQHGSSP